LPVAAPHKGSPLGASLISVEHELCRRVAQLYRRLNSREAWPLYVIDENDEEIAVFAADGSFSSEMTDFLRGDKG
jgi:Zn-dependent protease with chaperone function